MPDISDFIEAGLRKGYKKEEVYKILLSKGYTKKDISKYESESVDEEILRESSSMSYLDKFGKILSNPKQFFKEVREPNIWGSFLLLLCVVAIGAGASYGLMLFLRAFMVNAFYFGWSYIYSLLFVYPILALVGSFIYAGSTHLASKSMGGKGNFVDSYNVCAYSLVASLFAFIPIIGMFSFIYSIIIAMFGVSEYHKLTLGKSFFAAATILLVLLIIIIGIVGLLIVSLSRAF